jgi:hypothetical protein
VHPKQSSFQEKQVAALEHDIVQKMGVKFSNGFNRDATLSRLLVYSSWHGSSFQVWLCAGIED